MRTFGDDSGGVSVPEGGPGGCRGAPCATWGFCVAESVRTLGGTPGPVGREVPGRVIGALSARPSDTQRSQGPLELPAPSSARAFLKKCFSASQMHSHFMRFFFFFLVFFGTRKQLRRRAAGPQRRSRRLPRGSRPPLCAKLCSWPTALSWSFTLDSAGTCSEAGPARPQVAPRACGPDGPTGTTLRRAFAAAAQPKVMDLSIKPDCAGRPCRSPSQEFGVFLL